MEVRIILDIAHMKSYVKRTLSEERYTHTLAVVKLAIELANIYGVDVKNAEISATLHDITKEKSKAEQLQKIEQSDIIMNTVLRNNESLYHSITAFLYVRDILKLENADILNAIRYHTTARENMSMLEKIIYVADACSYERTYTDAQRLRELASADIDECVIEVIEFTVSSLIKRRISIATDTINCYNSMIIDRNNKDEEKQKER